MQINAATNNQLESIKILIINAHNPNENNVDGITDFILFNLI